MPRWRGSWPCTGRTACPRRGPLLRLLAQFHNVLIYVLPGANVVKGALQHWVDDDRAALSPNEVYDKQERTTYSPNNRHNGIHFKCAGRWWHRREFELGECNANNGKHKKYQP